jgi:hypothetical protein
MASDVTTRIQVTLSVDTRAFSDAMAKAAAEVARFMGSLTGHPRLRAHLIAEAHQAQHHRLELPAVSAMHAAYDRRRRARGRRR